MDATLDERWQAYRADPSSLAALEALVEALSPLVVRVIERISIRLPEHVRRDDLLQAGLLGLCEAVERFDPAQGNSFQTFAQPRIRGAVIDELRQADPVPRSDRLRIRRIENAMESLTGTLKRVPTDLELAGAVGMTVDEMAQLLSESQPYLSLDDVVLTSGEGRDVRLRDVVSDVDAVPPDQALERQDLLRVLRSAFRMLPVREQKILYLYYYEDLRLAEIARLFEVTEARICQLHALAVAKLRAALEHLGYGAGRECRRHSA